MTENGHDLVVRIHREFLERSHAQRPSISELRTIHYTELPPSRPGVALAVEWETYRREAARLLAEGNEGRYVLIKGQQIIGIWDTREDASMMGHKLFPIQSFLIHQIQEREGILRVG